MTLSPASIDIRRASMPTRLKDVHETSDELAEQPNVRPAEVPAVVQQTLPGARIRPYVAKSRRYRRRKRASQNVSAAAASSADPTSLRPQIFVAPPAPMQDPATSTYASAARLRQPTIQPEISIAAQDQYLKTLLARSEAPSTTHSTTFSQTASRRPSASAQTFEVAQIEARQAVLQAGIEHSQDLFRQSCEMLRQLTEQASAQLELLSTLIHTSASSHLAIDRHALAAPVVSQSPQYTMPTFQDSLPHPLNLYQNLRRSSGPFHSPQQVDRLYQLLGTVSPQATPARPRMASLPPHMSPIFEQPEGTPVKLPALREEIANYTFPAPSPQSKPSLSSNKGARAAVEKPRTSFSVFKEHLVAPSIRRSSAQVDAAAKLPAKPSAFDSWRAGNENIVPFQPQLLKQPMVEKTGAFKQVQAAFKPPKKWSQESDAASTSSSSTASTVRPKALRNKTNARPLRV